MKSEKDCKYWKDGICILVEHPDCKGEPIGDKYFDSVHPCDFMTVPCFDD